MEGGSNPVLQWLVQNNKTSRGPDLWMKYVIMKMETEVIVNPRGMTVNVSLA
ncbi:hypothetical protein [Bacillus sp. AFS014408]|uniref:hypothetical protein n=1 Tax=Bacillus sp. AFS014408 TaxID=2034278 RepID=UPI001596A0CF|nr:hypothetical protein [Bacillus sp. AFS014408]